MLHDFHQHDGLKRYHNILKQWQEKINLIGPSTVEDIIMRHFQDSAQLMPFLCSGENVYDLGSGAGFPGLVLNILEPSLKVSLIESDSKKCAFLRTVSRETNCKAIVINKRIEDCKDLPSPDVVTARALAKINELLIYSRPWLEKNKNLRCLYLKGQTTAQEINEALSLGWTFDYSLTSSTTSDNAFVVLLRNIRYVG